MKMSTKTQSIVAATKNNGFNPVIGDIWLMSKYWKSWWRGNVNNFHHFTQKINGVSKKFQRRTLNTYKMVCEEWESLIWSENVKLSIKNNEKANKRLQEVLIENNDYLEMGNLIEKTFALGNGLTVVYKANGKTNIDYISGQSFIPIAFENNTMTGVVTINESQQIENDKPIYITHLTYHWLDNDGYNIKHEVYKSDKEGELGTYTLDNIAYVFNQEEADSMLVEIGEDKIQAHMVVIDSDLKFFQPYRPNIANNYDETSMGVPIGANMIDLFESVDIKFDASTNEILNNKTRILVNSKAYTKQPVTDAETGETTWIKYLDESDTVIMALPYDDEDGEMIKHFQGEIRMEQIKIGIQLDINMIGWRSGFGKKYFSFEDGEAYVNEKNVISSNSALFKNKRKHENLIEAALIEKAKAIMFLENDMGNISVKVDELEYEVVFDDSIISDDDSYFTTLKEDTMAGFFPKYFYNMKKYGFTEKEAKEWVELAQKEQDEYAMSFINDVENEDEENKQTEEIVEE